jgi:hypothetical protein
LRDPARLPSVGPVRASENIERSAFELRQGAALQTRKSANQVNRVWKIFSCGRMMRLRRRVLRFEGGPVMPMVNSETSDETGDQENYQTYEVFKKSADNTTVSVETVKGLEEGKNVLAALRNNKSNDEYYLFDPISGNVIDPDRPSSLHRSARQLTSTVFPAQIKKEEASWQSTGKRQEKA